MSKAKTTSRLKSMIKSTNRHFFRQLGRIFKYGAIGFGRNIWLSITATIVASLTLILLLATVVAGAVLNSTADAMRQKIDISVFFEPGTSKSDLASMASTLKQNDNVKSVEYSTSEEEFEKLKQEYVTKDDQNMLNTIDIVGEEVFIKKQPAAMRIKVYDTDNLDGIKTIVNTDEEFQENISKDKDKAPTYDTNSSAIATISSWANIATKGGGALSILFIIISTLVIFNTIRMAIYSRSEEIYMEKLVGADNSFIRGPFLVEAMISGIAAGIIAGTIGLISYNALAPNLKAYEISVDAVNEFLADPKNIVLLFIVLIGTGIIITLISARLAIKKYLKKF
ncbi:permease-like cell division protein FtsX [Candidatus Saccharibacteria bacterium]|nr:permease-like cell division protein FtsX [Candidatus Saccharibacteria bacterium]